MPAPAESVLAAWESFYVIVGSSSAALTGLMFVVISLVIDRRHPEAGRGIAAFATPTVVHFSAVFVISAVLSAPWAGAGVPFALAGLTGLFGAGYVLNVIRRARHQSLYVPVGEDWIWHVILPFIAYLDFAIAGLGLAHSPSTAYAIAACTLLLLVCGIHNSWDAVAYTMSHPDAMTPPPPENRPPSK